VRKGIDQSQTIFGVRKEIKQSSACVKK